MTLSAVGFSCRRSLPFVLFFLVLQAESTTSLAGVVVGFPDREAKQRRPEYLGHDRYRQELLRHGIQADLCPEPLNVAQLKEFNVIVYGGFSEDPKINALDAETRKRANAERQALEQYVSSGGGLIVLPTLRRYPGQAIDEYYNVVLEGFGIKVLSEGIWDPQHSFMSAGTLAWPTAPYFMTAQIKPHEVTQGVQRLALPQTFQEVLRPAVAALSYSRDWTVVVTGEATAQSYKLSGEYRFDFKQPGTYKSAPPIVAVREFGKGRVLCYPINLAHATLNFGNTIWPHTVETAGDANGKQPSFGQQMMLNAIAWVSTPSQRLTTIGQRPVPTRFPPVHWEEKIQLSPPSKVAKGPVVLERGIIGAHSSLSDGQGSVEDYARAAAAAKLQFLVFAEALEQLTADKWRTLVEKCRDLSQKGPVYVVPGFEYMDVNGARWAIWGKQVIYPRNDYFTHDGKRIFQHGALEFQSNLAARMLLDYDKLPGSPANMWWYYSVPLWVYDREKLVADNLAQYLTARDNLYAVTATCFTRIKSPSEVAAAALRCTWNVDPGHHPKLAAAVDTSASQWQSWTSVSQGGAKGPQLAGVEVQSQNGNVYHTRGTQRVRGAFRASSIVGLKEVRLHDGSRGIVRRFLCNGAREFSRTFELTHDRQHELVLEAIDREGQRAISTSQRLFLYPQGFYRCGDNLNTLGSTPTVCMPDRMDFPRFPTFEDYDLIALRGFDTGTGFMNKPEANQTTFSVRTTAGEQGIHYLRPSPDDSGIRIVQTPMNVPFSSYEINVAEASSAKYVKKLLESSAHGPFMPECEVLPFATVERRVYLLRSRMDYFLKWNERRPHEAAADYQGDVFVHEGTVRFQQDVTLKGDLPVVLERVLYKGGSDYRQADTVLIADAERGDLALRYGPSEKYRQSGALRKGGWIAGQFTDGGTLAAVPAVEGLRYRIDTLSAGPKSLQWAYELGLGQDGQKVRKGEEMKYRYLAVCISSRTPKDDKLLRSIGPSFGLDPKGPNLVQVEVGQLISPEVFVTARAKNHEFLGKFQPAPLMINRPLRIEDIEDNGCVAVYATKGEAWEQHFRFVGAFEHAALFQENTDRGPTLWIGNPFYAENPKLRLTLVEDGIRSGEKPFLEVHNPTDAVVVTRIHSPQHTPHYGGFVKQVRVPAGDSILVDLSRRR